MNSSRIVYNYSLIPNLQINPYWLLGFIEGEGSFGLKNLSPYFQIGKPNQTKPNQTKPNQTKPNPTQPNTQKI